MKPFYIICICLFSFATTFASSLEKSASITVYIFLLEDCVISQNYTLPLRQLHEKFASERIEFIGIFPNRFSEPKTIAEFKETYQIPFELKYDYYQSLARKMGASVTPEVAVYDHQQEKILYKGRIDNTYFRVGKRRTITTTSELEDVLTALQDGVPITTENTTSIGCFIKYEEQ